MKNVRKIFIGILIVAAVPAYPDIFDDIVKSVGKSIGELFKMSDGFDNVSSACFEPKIENEDTKPSNLGMCDYVKGIESQLNSIDVCELVPNPDPNLFKKKSYALVSNNDLSEFCENAEKALTSAISDVDIYIKNQEGVSKGNVSGIERKPLDMLERPESLVRQALYNNNQRVVKDIYLRTEKDNNSGHVANITLKDLSAPSNYATYLKEVNLLAEQSMVDYIEQSSFKISSQVRFETAKIDSSEEAEKKALELTQKAAEHIDRGTSVRSAMYIDMLARNDDYAIPTQEMVNLLREDLRADAISKIKQQQKREALIMSELKQVDEARKRLLAIGGNKAIIISRKFDQEATQKEIDDLIEE
jgi:hypothetical protein